MNNILQFVSIHYLFGSRIAEAVRPQPKAGCLAPDQVHLRCLADRHDTESV